ncbi:MAG: lipopolysaccharide heptosyltransferase II [Gammaproteobacteria bacterium]|nr:MAG: lipopolysaccharide heptosyltransferase II [Gammaproteobacteria bacterium]
MVMAQSLYRLLEQRHAGAVIDVVAPPWSLPVLARMPEVAEAWPLDVAHGELGLAKRWRLGRALRARAYTRAIVLPRSWKSALLPFFAGVPRRTGFRSEFRYGLLNDLRPLDRQRLDQTVKRFLALGLPPGSALPEAPRPRLAVDPDNQDRLRQRYGLRPGSIALLPGAAYGPAKRWPAAHFAALAQGLLADGRQVWLLGSAAERGLAESIRKAGAGGALNLCGETRLEDAVDLLALAAAVVSNDSGLMHVAAAAGARVLAIYGSSSPAYTPPLTPRAEIFHLGLECSPCFQRECPLGHLRCLREIEPQRLLERLRAIG